MTDTNRPPQKHNEDIYHLNIDSESGIQKVLSPKSSSSIPVDESNFKTNQNPIQTAPTSPEPDIHKPKTDSFSSTPCFQKYLKKGEAEIIEKGVLLLENDVEIIEKGVLLLENRDGTIELDIHMNSMEAWLINPKDYDQMLIFIKDWEKNNKSYISDFSCISDNTYGMDGFSKGFKSPRSRFSKNCLDTKTEGSKGIEKNKNH